MIPIPYLIRVVALAMYVGTLSTFFLNMEEYRSAYRQSHINGALLICCFFIALILTAPLFFVVCLMLWWLIEFIRNY